ncbi:18365_t:CDS:2, partial [Acaulospora morrowiae]
SRAQFGAPSMGGNPMTGQSPGSGGGFDPTNLMGNNPNGKGNNGFDPSSLLGGANPSSGGGIDPAMLTGQPQPQKQAPKSVPQGNGQGAPAKAPSPQGTGKTPAQPSNTGENKAPSSGTPNATPTKSKTAATPDVRKLAWQEKEKACILVSGPPNNTIIQPQSKQRISWNQSPCQMSARVVGMFHVFLYNNLQAVPDEKAAKKRDIVKRDYSSNGKIIYDWGPYPIATNLTNTTNNYDWTVPYLYNEPRIKNASNFYIRVETISRSGIFGATPPLGGTYGPIQIAMKEPPLGWNETHADSSVSSGAQKMISPPSAAIKINVTRLIFIIGLLVIFSTAYVMRS